jgi:hypothetical protein
MAISIGTKIAGAALAGTLALGAGAVAWAADGSGTTPAQTSTPAAGKAAGKAGAGLGILRRADHGDAEIKVKGTNGAAATWVTVTFDRGQVSSVAADHITLARPDGQSVTLKIDGNTKYHGVTSWQQVKTNEPAVVISRAGTATQILQKAAAAAAPAAAPAAPAA